MTVALEGRGLTDNQNWAFEVPAGQTIEKSVTIALKPQIPLGRHILILRNSDAYGVEPVDAFIALDVE